MPYSCTVSTTKGRKLQLKCVIISNSHGSLRESCLWKTVSSCHSYSAQFVWYTYCSETNLTHNYHPLRNFPVAYTNFRKLITPFWFSGQSKLVKRKKTNRLMTFYRDGNNASHIYVNQRLCVRSNIITTIWTGCITCPHIIIILWEKLKCSQGLSASACKPQMSISFNNMSNQVHFYFLIYTTIIHNTRPPLNIVKCF